MVPLYRGWDVFETLVPHALSLQAVFLRYKPVLLLEPNLQFAELLASIGPYLYERGLHTPGLALLSTAEEICTVLETRKPSRADGYNAAVVFEPPTEPLCLRANIMAYTWGLWTVTGGIRARPQARVYATAIVALREERISRTPENKLSIADHILLANAYNDLAFQCLDEAKYGEAEPLVHRAMEMKVRFHTAGDRGEQSSIIIPQFKFATPMKDLALIRLAQGRRAEALTLCSEAKYLVEAEEGVTSASTQLFRFMFAVVLYNTAASSAGFGAARELHESVLASRVARFGERGCVTLHSRFWVALCCWRMGEHRLARLVERHRCRLSFLSWRTTTNGEVQGVDSRVSSRRRYVELVAEGVRNSREVSVRLNLARFWRSGEGAVCLGAGKGREGRPSHSTRPGTACAAG
jgi:hypothetical protein